MSIKHRQDDRTVIMGSKPWGVGVVAAAKKCTKCKITKPADAFRRDRSKKDGREPWCKDCKNDYDKANSEKISARKKESYKANREKIRARQKEYNKANREKISARKKEYYKANSEKIRARRKESYKANREKIRARQKESYKANREKVMARQVAYARSRRKADPHYRFYRNYRNRLFRFFSGSRKTAPTAIALGCSAKHACDHLESQFAEGMTWANYGTEWVVDHIFPLSKADLEDPVEFAAVCNWRNLQPLTWKENGEKSDRVTPAARKLFKELCEMFTKRICDEHQTPTG